MVEPRYGVDLEQLPPVEPIVLPAAPLWFKIFMAVAFLGSALALAWAGAR